MGRHELPAEVSDHGGSLSRARRLFPHAPLPWIDLSTGINPHSYPVPDLPATAFSALPDAARLAELQRAAAKFYAAPSADKIVAAPGTQILLPLVMGLVAPARAVVLGPTYAEHARAARIAGHSVTETDDFEAISGADIAVVVNPNNPDGRVITRAALLGLARRLASKGGVLVVDEAFMEVGPQHESVARDAGMPGLVVLRSWGKFFGLAGLRLGFALAGPHIASQLAARLGPWAVSGPALECGIAALSDGAWRTEMLSRLQAGAGRLYTMRGHHSLFVAGGTALFRFVRTDRAGRIFATLGRHGILIRNFEAMPDALRFGLPADEQAFARLDAALAEAA